LLVIAGLGYAIDALGSVLFAGYQANVATSSFVGEVVLIAWLLVKGRRPSRELVPQLIVYRTSPGLRICFGHRGGQRFRSFGPVLRPALSANVTSGTANEVIAMSMSTYPVRVDADLDPQLSRWLWLVKWFLAIPHYFLLAFLWMAFVVVSVIAFFSIAFTGGYPRSLFEFNVGVLRWSWRVHYYTLGALATDHYPPFTLAEVPDYPAHLDIAYPDKLSRGLVWVKWWLLAIPQYLIVAIFVGGGTWAAWQSDTMKFNWAPGGLLGLLVLIAAIILLVTGRYPRQIFDFVLGVNRWVLRVAAYAALMTDDYPPFRLDLGGHEPGATLTVAPSVRAPEPPPSPPPGRWAPPEQPVRRGWTGARITALVAGSVVALLSLGLLAGGGVATWADNSQRDAAGYLTTGSHNFSSDTYALTSGKVDLGSSADAVTPSDILGTIRVRVTSTNPQKRLFVGIAPTTAVNRYLAGVSHAEISNWPQGTTTYRPGSGTVPAGNPGNQKFWSAQSEGAGAQTLTWNPRPGTWTIAVMNTTASPGLDVSADIGATIPDLGWIALGLLAAGAVLLFIGGALVVVPVIRASR
jgi:hypothetical protein